MKLLPTTLYSITILWQKHQRDHQAKIYWFALERVHHIRAGFVNTAMGMLMDVPIGQYGISIRLFIEVWHKYLWSLPVPSQCVAWKQAHPMTAGNETTHVQQHKCDEKSNQTWCTWHNTFAIGDPLFQQNDNYDKHDREHTKFCSRSQDLIQEATLIKGRQHQTGLIHGNSRLHKDSYNMHYHPQTST